MRLLYDEENWYIESSGKRQLFRKFMEEKRLMRGLTKNAVEIAAGVNHPMYTNFENGTTKNPGSGLIALPALGFDLYIFGGKLEDSDEDC